LTDILFLAVIIEEYCVKAQGKNELYVMQAKEEFSTVWGVI